MTQEQNQVVSQETEATHLMQEAFQALQMSPLTIREMLEAGVHFGHQTNRWDPKMKPYIYGARNGIHIIDLQQTLPLFQKAHQFVVNTVAHGGSILFVGTKKQVQELVQEEATRGGMYYVNNRWLGGTLTNFRTIKSSIERLRDVEKALEDTSNRLTKKELLLKQREREKLEKSLGGIKNMSRLPAALFVIDAKKEQLAVVEARRLKIPVIAIADTNSDPDLIDYLIPGNDDAIRSVQLLLSKVADACIVGTRLAKERAAASHAHAEERAESQAATPTASSERPPRGPKVETVRRRGSRGAPAAAATPTSVEINPEADLSAGSEEEK